MKDFGFKNNKARELFLESLRIDEEADKRIQEEVEELGVCLDTTMEMKTEAAGMRILADDIEKGIISEDEIEI